MHCSTEVFKTTTTTTTTTTCNLTAKVDRRGDPDDRNPHMNTSWPLTRVRTPGRDLFWTMAWDERRESKVAATPGRNSSVHTHHCGSEKTCGALSSALIVQICFSRCTSAECLLRWSRHWMEKLQTAQCSGFHLDMSEHAQEWMTEMREWAWGLPFFAQ